MKPLSKATANLLAPLNLSRNDQLKISLNRDGKYFLCEFYAKTYDGRKTGASYQVDRFISRFPEKKKLDSWPPCYEIACTDYTALIIDQCWPKDQLEVDDDAKLVMTYLLATCKQQDENANVYAKFKTLMEPTVPWHFNHVELRCPEALPDMPYETSEENPLSTYQKVALHNAMNSEGYALFMEQGTGKTPIVIARICNEAVKLRRGTLDVRTLKSTATAIASRYAARIKDECEALTTAMTEAINRKRAKLEAAANKAANKRQVSLDYHGTADMLLIKAREAVREAELWLGKRLVAINAEMKDLQAAYEAVVQQKQSTLTQLLNAECAQEIAKLKAKHRPGEKRMYRAIIVCPNSVRLNWYYEFVKFTTQAGKVTIIRGGEVARTKQLIEAFTPDDDDCLFTTIIISYDTLKQHWNKGLNVIDWDLAVLDESHYIKWPETDRHKIAMKLRDKTKNKMVLTGTPITNTGLDLFAQFEFMGEGWSGFGHWKNFRSFYGVYKPTSTGRQVLVGMQNLPFMQERLARLSFSVDKKEVLPYLPKKTYDIYEVTMTGQQAEMYTKLRDQLAIEIEDDLNEAENKSLVINNILTKLLRLAQITSGHIKWDAVVDDDGETLQEGKIQRLTPNPKIEGVLDILSTKTADEKTLIWATFVEDIKSLSEALTAASIDHVVYYGGTSEQAREDAVRRFNTDPKCKVFIGNPAAGGVGLNLTGFDPNNPKDYTTDCDHVIYFSQNWSSVQRAQSEDRAHRRITRKPIRYTDLMVPNTIDEEIRDRVTMKRLNAATIADIREILKNVLRKELE